MPDALPLCVSTFGGDIDAVIRLIYWITGIWFVAAEGVLLWFLFRFRRRNGVRAAWVPGNTRKALAWIFGPAALVLACDLWIEAASSATWRKVKIDMPAWDTVVKVTGQQFAWQFDYPGPDGKLGTDDDIASINEMHVPRDKVVRFELTAKDVLHSFCVNELRLKQDAIPGRTIPGWFTVTQDGTYTIACAELCGTGHTYMMGKLVVESPEAFAAWLGSKRGQ